MRRHAFEATPGALDAMREDAAVHLDLFLALAASKATAAALTREVTPHTDEVRLRVSSAREFDLQLRLAAPRAAREDLEDHRVPIVDLHVGTLSEIAHMDGRKRDIEYDDTRAVFDRLRDDSVRLSATYIYRGIDAAHVDGARADRRDPGSPTQPVQFFKRTLRPFPRTIGRRKRTNQVRLIGPCIGRRRCPFLKERIRFILQ
jgi:hypothetical protein